jgi:outer membrane biosynthesis protein TonB
VEDAVVKVHDKTKKPEKKVDPPKEQEKPKKPTREERLREMRARAKDTTNRPKPQKPQPNGRTEKRPPNLEELLNKDYKPGRTTQLAASEEQRCLSLIKMAFESKWERPPWTDTLKPMVIKVKFGPGGVILAYNLTSSSGDAAADQSILSAARRVGSVRGLTADFLNKYKGGLEIRFTVTPQ